MKVKDLINKLLECDRETDIPIDEKIIPACSGNRTYTIDLFLEKEIPFRLTQYFCVEEKDAEEIKDEILNKLCLSRGGDFDFIDYDAFDDFIGNILDEHGIKHI